MPPAPGRRDLRSGHPADYLRLRRAGMHVIPLGIDFAGHSGSPKPASRPFTVGYFARIAPEKGLHHLVDAALLLHARRPGEFRIRAGGYLNPQHRSYFAGVQKAAAPLGDAFASIGSPATLADKVAFYQSLDVLSVPTEFHEPKGLYVLEALANGVPVIQPNHGTFPELIEATGGGLLVEPKNPGALAEAIERLADHPQLHQDLSRTGHTNVHETFNLKHMAEETLKILTTQSYHDNRDSL